MEIKIIDLLKSLKAGKQVRIIYEKFNMDGTEDGSGWKEELWLYNKETNLCECYYPVSTYPTGYCTYHTVDYARSNFEEAIHDLDKSKGPVEDIIIEENGIWENKEALKEKAIKKIEQMSDEELRIFLLKM